MYKNSNIREVELFIRRFNCVNPYYQLYQKHKVKRELKKNRHLELGFLDFLIPKESVSVDCGANVGHYTYVMSQYSSHVHAFEPVKHLADLLYKVSPKNVTIHPVALSNKNGTAQMAVPCNSKGKHGYGGASLQESKYTKIGKFDLVEVETKKLDSYNLNNVGFIKIDVEGFEKELLQGAQETIKNNKPNLLIELEERYRKGSIDDLVREVDVLGYTGFCLSRDRGLITLKNFNKKRYNVPDTNLYINNFIFLPI